MRKKKVIFLEGKNIYLRPLDLSDAPLLQLYANDPDVRRYLANVYPVSILDEEEWIKRSMSRSTGNVLLVVVLKKSNKVLGCMGIHGIDAVNRNAFTGSMLGAKDEWNKGYAQEAKKLLLEYAFNTLNLQKVFSTAASPNKGSIKHNQNCGYKIEGVQKQHFYRDGKYLDNILLAIFKKDWLKLQKQKK